MPEQVVKAGELKKAEEVLDVVLPSGDKAAEVVHPREEPFHSPAPTDRAEPTAPKSNSGRTQATPVSAERLQNAFKAGLTYL